MKKESLKTKAGTVIITMLAAVILMMPTTVMAGNLDPTGPPDNASSAMYTLKDIYDYLDTGVAGTKRTGGFTEPSSGPESTGHTLDEIHEKIGETCFETCEGTLNGTRWCDQGDGTVKDMATGLVWLKNANCFGVKKWIDSSTFNDAQTSSGTLKSGSCDLTDGSVEGDWRLPTKSELQSIGTDPPATWTSDRPSVTWTMPGTPFDSVQSSLYWSSTTYASSTSLAWYMDMFNGDASFTNKDYAISVWPVRSDN